MMLPTQQTMAEIVCSAVAGEAARRLSSFLPGSGEDGDPESHDDRAERLELAVLKLDTVVAVSDEWQITQPPLLLWKAKLRRVAREGKALLRARKKHRRRSGGGAGGAASVLRRLARHLAVPFRYAAVGEGLVGVATVRRFERLAGGADDFLRLVERGGRPKSPMPTCLPAIVRSLRAGKAVELSLRMGPHTAVILLQPWWLDDDDGHGHGGEADDDHAKKACLWMSFEHDLALEKNLKLITVFHLSDHVDVTRIVMDSVQLLPPQFVSDRSAMEELLTEMASYGRNPPHPSELYMRFVRTIQGTHRYGFEIGTRGGKCSSRGGLGFLPGPILLVSAQCYIMPAEKLSGHPLELVWHASPRYLPKKLSEQHETVEQPEMVGEALLPKVTKGGFYREEEEEGAFSHERQWWCPRSSTRLSMAPVLSPPTTLKEWCARQKQGH
ncbi:hypothetical protein ACP4OV_006865 [Aristida adscensionis]